MQKVRVSKNRETIMVRSGRSVLRASVDGAGLAPGACSEWILDIMRIRHS